jgi:hypothetical protein
MSRRRRKGPGLPFAISGVLLVLLVGGAATVWLLLRNRDESTTTPPPATSTAQTTTGTTTTAAQTDLLVYFVRDGLMGAASRSVPQTTAVATAALGQLFAGPSQTEQDAGLTTSIPDGTSLQQLTITAGVAHVKVDHDLDPTAQSQVVFTLTQFPTVHEVQIASPGGTGKSLDRTQLEQQSPAILVEAPTPGETVTSPFTVSGTADTFEATLQLELTDSSGKVLAKKFLTATSGNGTRGTFSGTLSFTATPATGLVLTAYENSAESGKRIHVVKIPLTAG